MLSVAIGAVANLVLDPLFIFGFNFGIKGAAIATVISQILSAVYVLHFLRKKAELKVRLMTLSEFSENTRYAKDIISLGTSGCVMQLTNSLVSICCNNVLSVTGGDLYISGEKIHFHYGTARASIYSCHVECDHTCSSCPDCYFQFRCHPYG